MENGLDIIDLKYQNKKEVAKGTLLGFFIGLAVIIPGVSGSAVAIIFKLYEKLLATISNLFKAFKVCVLFLLPIVIGAILGFVLGFLGVQQLLNIIPFATVALFAGLMLGAYPAVLNEVKGEKNTPLRIVLFVLGIAIPVVVSAISVNFGSGPNSLDNLNWYHYVLFLVLGFAVALTQLVPGLSATALLMMAGYFSPIVDSVSFTYWSSNPMVFLVYGCLAVGFLIGLFTLAKFISFILKKFRVPAFFVICGLSLGSFISMFYNPEIVETYEAMDLSTTSDIVDLVLGIVLFIVGLVGAYILVRIEIKGTNKETGSEEPA